MANLCLAALETLRGFMLAPDGVNSDLAAIAVRDEVICPELKERQILLWHVPAPLADSNEPLDYPTLYLYCDRMDNRLERKFRAFSGPIFIVAEIRFSAPSFENLEQRANQYVEAVTSVLGRHLGKWTDSVAFNGAYEVQFKPVETGGLGFLQRAEIAVELQAHA